MVTYTIGSVLGCLVCIGVTFLTVSLIFEHKYSRYSANKKDELITVYQKGVFDGREQERSALEFALTQTNKGLQKSFAIDNDEQYYSPESMIASGLTELGTKRIIEEK